MMKVIRRIVSMSVLLLLLASCSTTRFVEDNQYLLDKVVIESDNPDFGTSELNSYVRQQPNFKLFGLVKWQLYVYNWSGRNANNWFNKQLRRIGEAPVILDSMMVEQSQAELGRFLFNKGYIDAGVTSSIDTVRRKKAVVTYHVTSNEPYRIREYNSRVDDARIDSIIHLTPVKRSALSNTFRSASENFTPLVKEGNLFDRDVLDEERQRATSLLRRRGYYAFNRDYLGYLADSTHNQHLVDVDLVLKPFREYKADGSVTEVPHRQYYINNVSILTDYNALDDNLSTRFIPTDTVKNNALTIVYGQRGKSIRSNVLRDAVYLSPGQLYNERNVEQTYSALTSLRALKNVNLRFSEYEENDSLKLDCIIQTSFSKPQSIGFDVEGTNNAGDLGFASSLTYQHRNIFRGAEVFSARIRGAYESLGGSDSYWEYGGEASILFPRFLFPFLDYDFKRRLRASTELRLSYNKQDRPEYERSIFSGSWNYIWQDRSNVLARHTFKLLDVDYVLLPSIDPDFKNSLPEALLRYNYTDQFIVATGYTYSFNNYSPQNRMRNTHSLRVSVETAGNVLYALSNLTKSSKDSNGRYSLFGTNYSQFVKADIDVSRGIVLDNRSRLAFHVGVGVGEPYGNAEMLPFERRYFSGGANSVRGWSVRDLGPGSMAVNDTTSFAYQVGDVRLDLNVEYRTKLFWKFELAAYVDAGNIWTIRPYVDQPDGNFDFSRFYKEIAVSYGLGLRLDFDFFLLRFDTGFKAYNPQERGSKRWPISHPNFGKNFAWHFAVGYPF